MKTVTVLALAGLSLAAGFSTATGQVSVLVNNRLAMTRPGEIVEVRWSDIRAALPAVDPKTVAVRDAKTKNILPVQIIDENLDGVPEKLLFQSGFKAGEEREFEIVSISVGSSVVPQTDVCFVPPREDLAWENDRVAFRMYGPPLAKEGSNNGIDVWTKRVRSLIVKKWYDGEEETPKISYHEDHGEGADYFTVGSTLGAGACALLKGDSLCQPGVFAEHRIIATGPLRGIFELTYKPVMFDGKSVAEHLRVTLDAGSNLNRIDATFVSAAGQGRASVAAGIVKRKGTITTINKNAGWVSLWGPTTDDPAVGELGLGIVMPKGKISGMKEDNVHVLVLSRAEFGQPVTYYAGAGWTRSGDCASSKDWEHMLTTFAQRLGSPLVVRVVKR